MGQSTLDVLMITYNRPEYTRLALGRLLESCSDSMRVWLWHNGTHEETLEISREFSKHPAVFKYHHSVANVRLRTPTNWLFNESTADFVSKVDDDCLVPQHWFETLSLAHEENPNIGILGCWRFQPEDYDPALAERKIVQLSGGHSMLANCWVEGSGYVMKRKCISDAGLIKEKMSFPGYCILLARKGWGIGWYHPFLYQEHMDDPRAKHTLIHNDDDLRKYMPLSAANFGAKTLSDWDAQLRRSAMTVQAAPADPAAFSRWRVFLRRKVYARLAKRFGFQAPLW